MVTSLYCLRFHDERSLRACHDEVSYLATNIGPCTTTLVIDGNCLFVESKWGTATSAASDLAFWKRVADKYSASLNAGRKD